MKPTPKTEPYEVRWPKSENIYSRLKYYIHSTGVNLAVNRDGDQLFIESFNSLGSITVGRITIPLDKVPELIKQLQRFHFDHTK